MTWTKAEKAAYMKNYKKTYCKKKKAAQDKAYREKDPVALAAKKKAYYEANKENLSKGCKAPEEFYSGT